jgi:hypothetical protein
MQEEKAIKIIKKILRKEWKIAMLQTNFIAPNKFYFSKHL